ncbi:Protein of unknown function [Bacillus wiedmannii]|nr:Protein of unknown function [Bacillus wiedmannii]
MKPHQVITALCAVLMVIFTVMFGVLNLIN